MESHLLCYAGKERAGVACNKMQFLPVKVILVSSLWKFNQYRLHCNTLVRPVGEDAEENGRKIKRDLEKVRLPVKLNIQKYLFFFFLHKFHTVMFDRLVAMPDSAMGYSIGRMVTWESGV